MNPMEHDNLHYPDLEHENIPQEAPIKPTSAFYHLLSELQAVDFVLTDLTLYLDTHPDDGDAIAQYNHLTMQRKRLKEEYEKRFGPLSGFGGSFSPYPWSYGKTPWPWQV